MELPELPEDLERLPHMAWLHTKMLKLYRGKGQILVTHDRNTMPSQFAQFIASF